MWNSQQFNNAFNSKWHLLAAAFKHIGGGMCLFEMMNEEKSGLHKRALFMTQEKRRDNPLQFALSNSEHEI